MRSARSGTALPPSASLTYLPQPLSGLPSCRKNVSVSSRLLQDTTALRRRRAGAHTPRYGLRRWLRHPRLRDGRRSSPRTRCVLAASTAAPCRIIIPAAVALTEPGTGRIKSRKIEVACKASASRVTRELYSCSAAAERLLDSHRRVKQWSYRFKARRKSHTYGPDGA